MMLELLSDLVERFPYFFVGTFIEAYRKAHPWQGERINFPTFS